MRNFKLILVALSMLPAPAHALEVPFFPRLTATNLAHERLVLPRAFAGDRNVLAIAFNRRQRADVDGWTLWLNDLEATRAGVRWYELPMMSRTTGGAVGRLVDRRWRRNIRDVAQRRRTIPLHVDKARFRYLLGLPEGEDAIQLLVVNRRGDILGRASGRFSAANAAAIEAALR